MYHPSSFARPFATLLVVTFSILGLPEHTLAARSEGTPREDLFDTEDLLDLTLQGDLRPIYKDKSEDRPYRPARLWYLDNEGDTVAFDLGVKTRGFFRRLHLNCNVPPLRLNFKKKETPHTVFAGQDKLKLVTHCRDKNEAFEQYTLQEYLIYKAYNLLSDNSFRVRLVRVTYIDTESKQDPMTKYGFLIEDEDRLAERLGGRSLESGRIHQEATDKEQATLLAVFQYMIGNTDWTVPTHHNIKFVFLGPNVPPLSIPYDFDMAGIISVPYARPDPQLGIRSVRDRLFRGYCRTEDEFQATFARFNEHRESIYALYQHFPYLEQKYKDQSLDYLSQFYDTINTSRSIRRAFLAVCLKG